MARKPSIKTAENSTQAIADALDTPLNFDWDTTAEKLSVTVPELQERMASKLDDTVFTWLNIPTEHQPIVDSIARDLDAEPSTRKLEPQVEIPQLPEAVAPPILEDESSEISGKHAKKEPTGLTQTKSEKLP